MVSMVSALFALPSCLRYLCHLRRRGCAGECGCHLSQFLVCAPQSPVMNTYSSSSTFLDERPQNGAAANQPLVHQVTIHWTEVDVQTGEWDGLGHSWQGEVHCHFIENVYPNFILVRCHASQIYSWFIIGRGESMPYPAWYFAHGIWTLHYPVC